MDADEVRATLEKVIQAQNDTYPPTKGRSLESRLCLAVCLLAKALEEVLEEVELLQAERELREAERRRN